MINLFVYSCIASSLTTLAVSLQVDASRLSLFSETLQCFVLVLVTEEGHDLTFPFALS